MQPYLLLIVVAGWKGVIETVLDWLLYVCENSSRKDVQNQSHQICLETLVLISHGAGIFGFNNILIIN